MNLIKDKLIIRCFLSTLFYSISYPFVHLWLMKFINEQYFSLNQIIICLSVILFNTIWNKHSEKLYNYFPALLIAEIILYSILNISVLFGTNAVIYYLLDTLILSLISKNILCGLNRMKSIKYKDKDREKYDNTVMIANSAATLLGNSAVLFLDIHLHIAIIISLIGLLIDNLFCLLVYKENKQQ